MSEPIKRRRYTVAELELVQDFLLPFSNGVEKAIRQARYAVQVADCNMTQGQLKYWLNCRGCLKWIGTSIRNSLKSQVKHER